MSKSLPIASVISILSTPASSSLLLTRHNTDVPQLRGAGGRGFDPGPRHTKVIKNGTSGSLLGTQTYGVELGLVDPVSG